jgi:predicted alpha/beta-hydrolase family hydrolase
MSQAPEISVYPAGSPFAAMVVAPGAGAGRMSHFMVQAAEGLAARGVTAVTFDFPYITAGRHVPDKAPVLEACWREAIAAAREQTAALPLFIGGKSMGGRIASHIASQGIDGVRGLIFFGYPLHPPGKPQQRRDAHLPGIGEPMLFLQGSRDAFGTSTEIRALVQQLQCARLEEIEGGDHSFKVSGAKKGTSVLPRILDRTVEWIRGIVGTT